MTIRLMQRVAPHVPVFLPWLWPCLAPPAPADLRFLSQGPNSSIYPVSESPLDSDCEEWCVITDGGLNSSRDGTLRWMEQRDGILIQ